jgi:hypothetical protein
MNHEEEPRPRPTAAVFMIMGVILVGLRWSRRSPIP